MPLFLSNVQCISYTRWLVEKLMKNIDEWIKFCQIRQNFYHQNFMLYSSMQIQNHVFLSGLTTVKLLPMPLDKSAYDLSIQLHDGSSTPTYIPLAVRCSRALTISFTAVNDT